MSNQKIFICVGLFASLLILSLFLFRSQNQPKEQMTVNPEGVIFKVAKEIKPFKLKTVDETGFSQKDFLNHWTLLFFGFTHCNSICPATLTFLNNLHNALIPTHPELQIVFVTLDPERDSPEKISKFLNSFNKNLIGLSGKIQDIRKLQSQFGIFSAKENTSNLPFADNAIENKNYQIQHTSSILLINPEARWSGIIHYGANKEYMVKILEKIHP